MIALRLQPLDALRGLIMILMALDHANGFIAHAHPLPEFWAGPYPEYPDGLAFVTRFVTHLAAPGFFLLMGAGMVLFEASRRQTGWARRSVLQHLLVRGLLLVALQFLVENPAWQLGAILSGRGGLFPIYFGVLYGLGGAMMMGALLLPLPPAALAGLGAAALLLPEVVIRAAPGLAQWPPVALLLVPALAESFIVYYPVVPWLGLALLGMAFGHQLLADRQRAYRLALFVGLALLAGFLLLRAARGFGNIRLIAYDDWIAFLNVVKYPPSLAFVAVALGFDLTCLALFSRLGRLAQPLAVLGRSPLFFYVAHLYLYGLLGAFFFPRGTGIPAMYPVWLLGLAILYGLCVWYGGFKQRQAPNSIWRFV